VWEAGLGDANSITAAHTALKAAQHHESAAQHRVSRTKLTAMPQRLTNNGSCNIGCDNEVIAQ